MMKITKITRQTNGRPDGKSNGGLENNSPNSWTGGELNDQLESNLGQTDGGIQS